MIYQLSAFLFDFSTKTSRDILCSVHTVQHDLIISGFDILRCRTWSALGSVPVSETVLSGTISTLWASHRAEADALYASFRESVCVQTAHADDLW